MPSGSLQVFQEVQALVTSCIDGYNVCIFAYGQTGAGKTAWGCYAKCQLLCRGWSMESGDFSKNGSTSPVNKVGKRSGIFIITARSQQ